MWRFAAARSASEAAELRAQKLIGLTFYAIALYVGFEAVRTLIAGDHPDVSYVGIVLAAATLATMPPLALAKARVGEQLGSSATKSEGRQNLLCAYLSGALLVGLGANAVAGLWWADPVTALVIAAVAVNEGRDAWCGESCCVDAGLNERADDRCQELAPADHSSRRRRRRRIARAPARSIPPIIAPIIATVAMVTNVEPPITVSHRRRVRA